MKSDEVRPLAEGWWERILSALAPQLQPALEKAGRHVPCPVHGGKDGYRLFKDVDVTGGSVCNTCGAFPDGFSTLMWANAWDFATTLKEVANYLGIGEALSASVTPIRAASPPVPATTQDDDESARRRLNHVWKASLPMLSPAAEPGRLYLARRGLPVIPPDIIRFHPALGYYEDRKKTGEWPALVAMVSDAQGNPVTLHRIYLTPDGMKAPVEAPKKLMSFPSTREIMGGAIRLGPAKGPVLAVAEGLETALAVLEATGWPVWCAVNATLLAALVPPEGVSQILVFADKDRATKQHPKGHGQEAARHLVQRLWELGIQASAIIPAREILAGNKSLDWLDVFNRDGKAGFPSLQSVAARARRAA